MTRALSLAISAVLFYHANAQSVCEDLQAGFTPLFSGNTVQFANTTTGTGFQTNWYWTFGDGGMSDNPQPVHLYDEPGLYTVCLTALSMYEVPGQGVVTCVDTMCQTIQLGGEPSPCDGLNAEFTTTVDGQLVSFNNVLNSNQVSYLWDFGDGTEGYGQDPVHTYPAPGVYEACLLVWAWDPVEQDTCFADHCTSVLIQGGDPCDELQADFSATVGNATVFFSNATAGTGFQTTWHWDFGDGITSNDAQPSHIFPALGTYLVCLTAISIYEVPGQGVVTCVDSTCQEVYVGGEPSPCDSLSASFTYDVDGTSVIFVANGSNSLGYMWTFGDGQSANDGPTQIHTYAGPGEYHVCLITWTWDPQTQDTCYAEFCPWIVVGGGDPCDELQAGFTANVGNATVWFSNTTIGTGFQTTWNWDFGDGTTSNDAQPSHIYLASGTYQVCLTAISMHEQPGGGVVTCEDTYCAVVITGIGGPCDGLNADFSAFPGGLSVNIQNTVVNPTWSYQWFFGDGTEGEGPNPFHTYAEPGTYQVCLTVGAYDPITQDSCFEDHCAWIELLPGDPCDGFVVDYTWESITPNVFVFTATSSPEANGLIWHFGDGTQALGPTANHTYPGPGSYNACLVGWLLDPLAQDSCWSESCQTIVIVGDDPCAELQAGFTANVGNATVWFSNNTIGTGFQTTWNWDFGDGTTSNDAQPSHIFPGLGTYEVCLIATSIYEQPGGGVITCQDSVCQVVITGIGSPCDGLSAEWQAFGTGPTVNFQNLVVNPNWSYQWSFGDGSTGDGPNPAHVYDEPGEYFVCLIVGAYDPLTQDSCFEDFCQWIDILGEDPCDGFSVDFAWESVTASIIGFTASSSPEADGLIWYFGDGTQGFGPEVDHTYPGLGTYQVCLVGWLWNPLTQDSCWAESCEMIEVGGGDPCAQLQAGFFANVGDVTVQFSNTTIGTGFSTTWYWTFGDGTTSNDAQPSHIFPGLGTYEVCLIATSIYEQPGGGVITCQDSVCQVVITGIGSPCDGLSAEWQAFGTGSTVNFQNLVVNPNWSYQWSFGDGSTGDGPNPAHVYDEPGEYFVCLIVGAYDPLTQDSCFEDFCQWIDLVTGLNEERAPSMSVWPVPVLDDLNVSGPGLVGNMRLDVLDMSGRVVIEHRSYTSGTVRIDCSALLPGVYLLRPQDGTYTQPVRFTKH